MNFSRNTLLAAAVALTSIAVASQVQASCKGGGGGYSRGYSSSSYGGFNSHRSSSYGGYAAPVQSYAPSYSTPNYYSQPQQVIHSQPTIQSQPVQRTIAIRPVQQVSQQQLAPQQQVAPQQVAQAPQPQQTLQPQVQQPQTQAPVNAQMSALQALGGFAPPAAAPAPAPQQQQVQTPAHVGNWTATLGNGATVRLSLQADGNFSWVATNKTGSQSSFSGNYTVSNGSLTLNRSNDSQQLGGTMTLSNNNAFSFKVAGNNAAGINFSRS